MMRRQVYLKLSEFLPMSCRLNMRFFTFLLMLVFSNVACAINVSLIIPDNKGPAFWALVHQISAAAAERVDVNLEVIYGGENRYSVRSIIEEITARKNKPDYLIFRPFYGNATIVFDKVEASGIHFVTLEQAFSGDEAKQLQRPQQKYKYWIGEVSYDNASGGQLLLDALLSELQIQQPKLKASITAIGGDFDNLSQTREFALTQMQHNRDPRFNQVFPSHWNPNSLKENMDLILERYPTTNIFWCAGDQLGIETLKQYRQLSNKPIVIGGFDWLPEALTKIKQGELSASVGGHFLMGAIAIIKIVDFQNGIDRFSTHPESYQFELITRQNVDTYLDFLQKNNWDHVAFEQFSSSKTERTPLPLTVNNIIKFAKIKSW
jgi:ABC-type sugar transport system substrate-binding protein